jgi:hypothetical protein
MLILILAVVLLGVVGALGYLQGAIRLTVSLVGLFLGAVLALPLSPMAKPLIPLLGVKHPVWSIVWPPIIVFSVIFLLFIGIAFFVQRKVAHYYKYQTDDIGRIRWERLNKGLGLCLGLVMGGFWLFLLCLAVYGPGYLAVQVVSDDTSSAALRYLSKARHDLKSTGMERAVAPFDPLPPKYYQASDILGLIYNNPALLNRLSEYPPFLTIGARAEFQEIATDTEFNTLLQSKGDVAQILQHPKTQTIIYNPEILQELLQQDLPDLHKYLMTGKSPKFEEEKILGRWKLDLYSTMAQVRRKNPDMPASQMARMKKLINETLSAVSFTATTDNKATLKVEVTEAMRQAAQAAQQAAAAAAQARAQTAPGSSMTPEQRARYGLGQSPSRGTGAPGTPNPAPVATNAAPQQLVASAQGSWEHESDKYQIKLQDERNKGLTFEGVADDDKLTLVSPIVTLVFFKSE